MRNPAIFASFVASAGISAHAQSFQSPILEWYKTISGTGTSSVAGVATDSQGNFYIAGTTTSLDLPIAAAAQSLPGWFPVLRINTTSGLPSKLYGSFTAAVSNLSADPENPNTLYATSAGTVARSTDGGNTWRNLKGFPAGATANSVTVDPKNSGALYAATNGLGALKSTDSGVSWTAINNGIPPSSAASSVVDVYQTFVDPRSTNVVFAYVGQDLSLYRSANGGAGWAPALVPARGTLSFDPFTAGTIYASGSRSTDDGQTWTPLMSADESQIFSVVPDPFHPGTLFGLTGYVYKSTDAGLTWTPVAALANQSVASLVADPNQPVLYAALNNIFGPNGIVRSTDGFATYSSFGPSQTTSEGQLLVAGSFLYEVQSPYSDLFVAKLDSNGQVLYSTYFGGSDNDAAIGIAVGSDGSAYVTGKTNSADFPVTPGVYSTSFNANGSSAFDYYDYSNFLFKLNPDGSLAWSTFYPPFSDFLTYNSAVVSAVAVDASGSPYVASYGYSVAGCPIGSITPTPCAPPPLEGFVAKFTPSGSTLLFFADLLNAPVRSLVVGTNGNVYVSVNGSENKGEIFLMSPAGAMLSSNSSIPTVTSMAIDANGNLYATGAAYVASFPATPGAFQPLPSPRSSSPEATEAFVVKLDGGLTQVLAATLLGGSQNDGGNSIAIDPHTGNVIVSGYTNSLDFPTRAPFQGSFAIPSGFVAGLDPSLSQLLFSTYLGSEPFSAVGAFPDGSGNILLAGTAGGPTADLVSVNKISLSPAPAVRVDSIVNAASQLGQPLAPGENIAVLGAGFGSDTQLFVDGAAIPIVSVSPNQVIAAVPADAPTSGARQVMASSGGTNSNTMYMPSAPLSPAIYSINGRGVGQGYILNADGTVNSASNPAAAGAPITIFATGVGQISTVNGYAVTSLPVSVFVDGVYADGIAAFVKQVPSLPGNVYELSVFVPSGVTASNPPPPQSPITLVLGGVSSQPGITLYVK